MKWGGIYSEIKPEPKGDSINAYLVRDNAFIVSSNASLLTNISSLVSKKVPLGTIKYL